MEQRAIFRLSGYDRRILTGKEVQIVSEQHYACASIAIETKIHHLNRRKWFPHLCH